MKLGVGGDSAESIQKTQDWDFDGWLAKEKNYQKHIVEVLLMIMWAQIRVVVTEKYYSKGDDLKKKQ